MIGETPPSLEKYIVAFDALNERDFDAAKRLADPECEIRTLTSSLADRTYRGHAGVAQWFADVGESWEAISQTPERFIAVDAERTVVHLRFKARGKSSGVEINQMLTAMWRVRDGMVREVRNYATIDEALQAARLSESTMSPENVDLSVRVAGCRDPAGCGRVSYHR